jgi:rhamnosyl/mannosyltransferase
MKILHLTKYFWPQKGGIENYTLWLAEETRKRGYEPIVVCFDKKSKKEEIIKGIRVIRLPQFINFFGTPISRFILKELFELKPDIIHLHSPNPWLEFNLLLYRLFRKPKIIVTYHADIMNYTIIHFLANIVRFFFFVPLLCFTDKIIVTSPNYINGSFILKLFRKKIVVIPHGIDENKFRPMPIKKTKKKMLLFVGRLAKYKGLEYLIRAIASVKKERKDFYLVIVGDGELKEKLKMLVKELNLEKFVKFDYNASDRKLIKYYNKAYLFVLPSTSRAEAFGIVQLEAMSCGVPVISTNIKGSGVPFVNKHLETGIIVKPKNADEIAKAILTLLKNEKLAIKLGKNARARVLKYFTKKKMIERTFKLYLP